MTVSVVRMKKALAAPLMPLPSISTRITALSPTASEFGLEPGWV